MPNLTTLSCAIARGSGARRVVAAAAATNCLLAIVMLSPVWSCTPPLATRVAEGPYQQTLARVVVDLCQPERLEEQESDDQRAIQDQRRMREEIATDPAAIAARKGGQRVIQQQRRQQDEGGAEPAAEDTSEAADDDGGEQLDRQLDVEPFGRYGLVVAKRVERADHAADEGADPEGQQLVAERADAEDLRRIVLLPNGGEGAAEARASDVQHEQRQHRARGQRDHVHARVGSDRLAEQAQWRRF